MTARADAAKAERRGHTAPVAAGRLRPLTERILARLPGPRAASIVAWALVPWLNAGANVLLGDRGTSAVWEQSDVLVVLNYAAISVGVLVSLWGSDRIARQLERLGESASTLEHGGAVPQHEQPCRPTRRIRGDCSRSRKQVARASVRECPLRANRLAVPCASING